jgi:hypothetical protein
MAEPGDDAHPHTAETLAAAGITVTEAGKDRARAKLEAADARWTAAAWAALRTQVGMPARAA